MLSTVVQMSTLYSIDMSSFLFHLDDIVRCVEHFQWNQGSFLTALTISRNISSSVYMHNYCGETPHQESEPLLSRAKARGNYLVSSVEK